MITLDTNSLQWLLSLMQRKQNIDGKSFAQVHSVLLKVESGRLTGTALVKDGVSSLNRLSIPCTGEGTIPVTDINTWLGALKYHSSPLTITPKEGKVTLKSGRKQTTLTASSEALAFPHTPDTMATWAEKSESIADKLSIDKYIGGDGKEYPYMAKIVELDSTELYEAFRCDEMNGQKHNEFRIIGKYEGLFVNVGTELKGKTTTQISEGEFPVVFDATFNGGLDYVFKNLNNKVDISFFDFTTMGQGIKMFIDLGDGDFIFQASNLGA